MDSGIWEEDVKEVDKGVYNYSAGKRKGDEMSDFADVLFRFGLPGFPLFVVIILVYYDKLKSFLNGDVLLLISVFVVLFLGFVVQQLWFAWFDRSKWSYNSVNRPVLQVIRDRAKGIKYFLGDNSPFSGTNDEIYAVWESIVYAGKRDREMQKKASRTWDYFHVAAANALGLTFGSILAAILFPFYDFNWQPSPLLTLFIGFGIIAYFLWGKTMNTKRLIDNLEKNWAVMWLDDEGIKVPQTTPEKLSTNKSN